MPLPSRSIISALFFITVVLLAACSNQSVITHSYIDPKIDQRDLQGVLIVAVAQQDASRREFENAFTRALDRRGARAVASHTLVEDLDADAELFIEAAQEANLDTILVTRYIGETAQEVYHPGTVYYGVTPGYRGYYGGGFGGYYGHVYEVAYQQPVWTTNKSYTLISDLFATENRDHLWQAVSDTMRTGSNSALRDDIIDGFVDDIKDKGLLD